MSETCAASTGEETLAVQTRFDSLTRTAFAARHLVGLLGLAGCAMWLAGCLSSVAMGSVEFNQRKMSKKVHECREKEPVGYGVQPWPFLSRSSEKRQIMLRTCDYNGSADFASVTRDVEGFESLGVALRHFWGRDRHAVYVDAEPLFTTQTSGFDEPEHPALRPEGFGLPEPILLEGGGATEFVRAGDFVLSDEGIDRYGLIVNRHPIGFLAGADTESFVPLGLRYGRDRHGIWFLDQRVEGADPESFEVLGGNFARDGRAVYCRHVEIPGADLQSFRVISSLEARDDHHAYRIQREAGSGWVLHCDGEACLELPRQRTLPGQDL